MPDYAQADHKTKAQRIFKKKLVVLIAVAKN